VHFPEVMGGQYMLPEHVQEPLPIDPNPFPEIPRLNYNHAAFNQINQINQINHINQINQTAHIPKPTPPPPAREGFTRDTGTDTVAVCPSCDQELKYDQDDHNEGQPNRKGKTKRDKSEHHFWALKTCGHVRSSHL
jgi:hypothetical protein